MSVTNNIWIIVGAEFKKDDYCSLELIDTAKYCKCECEKNKFCSMCGRENASRIVAQFSWDPKLFPVNLREEVGKVLSESEFDFREFIFENDCQMKLSNGLSFISTYGYSTEKMFLGELVLQEIDECFEVSALNLEDLKVDSIQKKFEEMGIRSKVQILVVCFQS